MANARACRHNPAMLHLRPVLALAVSTLSLLAQETPSSNASGGALIPEQACYDVQRYDLTLEVDPEQKSIEGMLELRARAVAPTKRIALDLGQELQVRKVTAKGLAPKHEHVDGRIWIDFGNELAQGAEFTLTVAYGGKPRVARMPPWQGGFTWSKTKSGAPWIATSCQGEGADLWWPCKDHPSDKPSGMDLRITVPKGLVVASNGTLAGRKVQGQKELFHWTVNSPINNYCVAINIAPYVEIRDTYTSVAGDKVPFVMYVLPESEERARPFAKQFLDHLNWFERMLGPYPFRHEKYGVVETPHLGMEHQTIIAYGNGWRDEDYDWLHHHELAHEWWANLVTCSDWKDMWIHEGFGTYMQAWYLEELRGPEGYWREVKKWRALNRSPVAPREPTNSQRIYFGSGSNDIYYKGGLVLHTLRWQLGDEKFRECLRRFCYPVEGTWPTDGSQVRLVDTADFVALCTRIAGEDMQWFFDAYVHQAGLPRLVHEVKDGVLELRWEVAGDLPFPLAVPVEVDGEVRRVEMPGGRGTLTVGQAEPKVDPQGWLLRQRDRR